MTLSDYLTIAAGIISFPLLLLLGMVTGLTPIIAIIVIVTVPYWYFTRPDPLEKLWDELQ